jgi:hypothetical protein
MASPLLPKGSRSPCGCRLLAECGGGARSVNSVQLTFPCRMPGMPCSAESGRRTLKLITSIGFHIVMKVYILIKNKNNKDTI